MYCKQKLGWGLGWWGGGGSGGGGRGWVGLGSRAGVILIRFPYVLMMSGFRRFIKITPTHFPFLKTIEIEPCSGAPTYTFRKMAPCPFQNLNIVEVQNVEICNIICFEDVLVFSNFKSSST